MATRSWATCCSCSPGPNPASADAPTSAWQPVFAASAPPRVALALEAPRATLPFGVSLVRDTDTMKKDAMALYETGCSTTAREAIDSLLTFVNARDSPPDPAILDADAEQPYKDATSGQMRDPATS
jgi:hypothetical protein